MTEFEQLVLAELRVIRRQLERIAPPDPIAELLRQVYRVRPVASFTGREVVRLGEKSRG
jgi:DNA-directed RNA polymerase subunit H (RpoH/RPB5)